LVPALPLALFFELFWLDFIPHGSYIPPMPGFPYVILLALSTAMGWSEPTALAFPIAVVMPLAYAIPFLEYKQRNFQKIASTKLIDLAADGLLTLKNFPGRLIVRSCLQQAGGGLLVFLSVYALAHLVFSLAPHNGGRGLIPLDVDWSILYAIAAIGALLSLRIKRAYSVFALSMAGLFLLR
jgi:PTS system mannose-specific IIC component